MNRPTTVTVFAILNLIFGGIGLACSPLGLLVLVAPQGGAPNPAVDALHYSLIYKAWYIGIIVLGTVAAAALIASGVGLWKQAGWGRKLAIGYAVYAIGAGILGQVMNAIYVYRPSLQILEFEGGNPEVVGGLIGGLIGGICGSCIGLLYPLILLFFMMRREVVEAMDPEPIGYPDPSGFPPSSGY